MTAVLRQSRVLALRFARERRVLTAGVALGGMLMLWLQIAVYPSVRDSFAEMSDDLPEFFEQLVGSTEFATPEGFLQAEAFGSMAPILVTVVAVSTAASALAGSERSGRLDLLATTGVARRTIAASAAVSMFAAVSVVVLGYWFAAATGSWVADLGIGLGNLTAACLHLWALGVAIGASGFAAGAITGRRGTALGAGSVVALWSYLAYSLFPLVDSLRFLRYASLWYPYADAQPLWQGVAIAPLLLLLALAAALVTAGVLAFQRRDIG
ncbi:MAG: hypothetical protein DHS20C19_30580 [Acidimicrobiales bacterium]|nr:MAG: hypothetical protein DHS20C19_30580 [Acidimicrobiales bacterium]